MRNSWNICCFVSPQSLCFKTLVRFLPNWGSMSRLFLKWHLLKCWDSTSVDCLCRLKLKIKIIELIISIDCVYESETKKDEQVMEVCIFLKFSFNMLKMCIPKGILKCIVFLNSEAESGIFTSFWRYGNVGASRRFWRQSRFNWSEVYLICLFLNTFLSVV